MTFQVIEGDRAERLKKAFKSGAHRAKIGDSRWKFADIQLDQVVEFKIEDPIDRTRLQTALGAYGRRSGRKFSTRWDAEASTVTVYRSV